MPFAAQFRAGDVRPQVDGAGEEGAHEAADVVVAAHFLAQEGHRGACGLAAMSLMGARNWFRPARSCASRGSGGRSFIFTCRGLALTLRFEAGEARLPGFDGIVTAKFAGTRRARRPLHRRF